MSSYDFICFHPAIEKLTTHSNITWLKPSKEGFSQALQSCSGVIANAGFELASESLHLGKKLLLKPLDGQFEQLSNAVTLSQVGLCHIMHSIDSDAIEEWLHSAPWRVSSLEKMLVDMTRQDKLVPKVALNALIMSAPKFKAAAKELKGQVPVAAIGEFHFLLISV